MENFILFSNAFLSYLLLYIISIAVVVGAIFLGVRLRKNKDKKNAATAATTEKDQA